jgi:tetratricopeptide (TPR) repeat protein
MNVIRMAVLGMLFVVLAAPGVGFAGLRTADLMLEGIQAEEEGRPVIAREKFEEVLKKEPFNYHALVRLSQMEMKDLTGPNKYKRALEAERRFLLASIAQPHRPEAYLGLAKLNYELGYIEEGNRYSKVALGADPSCYEAFCLLGQQFEDSGNYYAAMSEYAAALNYYPFDLYLADKRYMAAAKGGLKPYKLVVVDVQDLKDIGIIFYIMANNDPDYQQLARYRQEAGHAAATRGKYDLPSFGFKYCSAASRPTNRYSDLYEAFLRATVKDEDEYRRLRDKLDKIRQEALKIIKSASGDKAKGPIPFSIR